MLYSVLLAATIAALAPASPIKRDETPTIYSVENWRYGCSPGGCAWHFNVTSAAQGDNSPAFSTYCSGTSYATDYVRCADITDTTGGTRYVGAVVNATPDLSNLTLKIEYYVAIENNTGYFIFYAETKVEATDHCPTCPTCYIVPVTSAIGIL